MEESDIDPATWAYHVDSEQSVLGGLLLDNTAYDRIVDVVRESDFFTRDHREIFRVIVRLIEDSKPADVLTVAELMERFGSLDKSGGQAYLGSLALNTPSAANIGRYAQIVAERSLLRALNAAATGIMAAVRNSRGKAARELLDEAQASVMSIRDATKGRGDFHMAGELVRDVVNFVDEQHARYINGTLGDVTGLPTGFSVLDRRTTGLQPGQLIVVAARPAMGKSAFALNVAEFSARFSKKTGLVFSLEMSLRELGLRLMSGQAQVSIQRLVTGRVYETEWPRVVEGTARLDDLPLAFCELGGLTVMELRSMARRAKREYGELSLIVVDYLQLMIGGDDGANRAAQLSEITRGLKLLAKELQVPVMALSQLNRDLEKRPNKRPTMADLRDSGSIEQDADLIWFIYRDEVYNPKTEDKGIAEVITGKQRNGPTGVDRLKFRGDFTRFSNEGEA